MKRWLMIALALLIGVLGAGVGLAQDAEAAPWWNERVFYEVFVRSFFDSDGDGIGDFRGLIEKMDYLNDGDPTTSDDLGVTGIWLMPINPSPSYHGYDVTDYYTVNPEFGTMEDFQALLDAAHARGIAVIVDLVINHTSSEHPWFTASAAQGTEFDDWYIWRDENPGFRGPWGQPVWHRKGDRYFYGVFWSGMPDLNYETDVVTDEMRAIADFWLEDIGVDGFRLDAVRHIVEDGERQDTTPQTIDWLTGFQSHIESVAPDALTVGEFFGVATFRLADIIERGAVNIAFDFDFGTKALNAASLGNARNVARQLARMEQEYGGAWQTATFLANHDQPRLLTQLVGSTDRNRVVAATLLTVPGVPFLYYGEEIGMFGGKPDERIRTPMQWDETSTAGFTSGQPWQPLADERDQLNNVAAQTDDPDSLLSFYRDLVQLRTRTPALAEGGFTAVEVSDPRVLAFLRHAGDEVVLVLINYNRNPVEELALSLEAGPLTAGQPVVWLFGEGDLAAPDVTASGGFEGYVPLQSIPGYGVAVIRLAGG
jgi:alpha-amylase